MITREQVLRKWARDWANLSAWARDLSEVEVEISDQVHPRRLGTCWAHEQRMVIYRGASIAVDLDTLLHEYAHAATIGNHHGADWQLTYATAIREVTGISVPSSVSNYRILCEAGSHAIECWWFLSGGDFLWKLGRPARP